MLQQLNIAERRQASSYSIGEIALRLFWAIGFLLFRLSPRPFHQWRVALLRLFGARIGNDVHIYNSAAIYYPWQLEVGDGSTIGEHAYIYNLGKITIGRRSTISQRAHLCAGSHDHRDPTMPLLRPPIEIGDDTWICSDAFVGPGVTVEAGAVVAARGVAVKDVPPWTIVGGNPAIEIKRREMYA